MGVADPDRCLHIGMNMKADYHTTVVPKTEPEDPDGARTDFMLADPNVRLRALEALKDAAKPSLRACEGESVMRVWRGVLEGIINSPVERLAECLYASLIVQAFAIAETAPVLLLTPALMEILRLVKDALARCKIVEAARSVLQTFWLTVACGEYGENELDFNALWRLLPWLGISAALSGSESNAPTDERCGIIWSFLALISKEQLCSNASPLAVWKSPPAALH